MRRTLAFGLTLSFAFLLSACAGEPSPRPRGFVEASPNALRQGPEGAAKSEPLPPLTPRRAHRPFGLEAVAPKPPRGHSAPEEPAGEREARPANEQNAARPERGPKPGSGRAPPAPGDAASAPTRAEAVEGAPTEELHAEEPRGADRAPRPDAERPAKALSGSRAGGDGPLEGRRDAASGAEREARRKAEALVRRLLDGEKEAERAYREIAHVEPLVARELIRYVRDPRRTRLRRIDVHVLQERFAAYEEHEKRFYYYIRGFGLFELDDIAAGPHRSGHGWRVRLRHFDGFPLGVVLRGALLNRFRDPRFPALDDRRSLEAWWYAYYDIVFGDR